MSSISVSLVPFHREQRLDRRDAYPTKRASLDPPVQRCCILFPTHTVLLRRPLLPQLRVTIDKKDVGGAIVPEFHVHLPCFILPSEDVSGSFFDGPVY